MRVAVRAATSGSARNFSAQTGANTAMTAFSELVLANFSAVFRLMKPKPYESSNIPTTTPPAPVHKEGFTTSQLILIGRSSSLREEVLYAHGPSGVLAKLLTPVGRILLKESNSHRAGSQQTFPLLKVERLRPK